MWDVRNLERKNWRRAAKNEPDESDGVFLEQIKLKSGKRKTETNFCTKKSMVNYGLSKKRFF